LTKYQITSRYNELACSGKFPNNTYLHQILLQIISSYFKNSNPSFILDAGSGAGFFGIDLAVSGHRVVMLDLALEALFLIQKRSLDKNCKSRIIIVNGDVENLPFEDQTFDSIVCIFVSAHLNDPNLAFSEFYRVLRENGNLIISFENKVWHVMAKGLQEKYNEAIYLLDSEKPIIKAYDILPPVRLYSIPEIETLSHNNGFKINSFRSLRHITSYQESLKGIGTTETEKLLKNNPEAYKLENLLIERGELRHLARHFLVFCRKNSGTVHRFGNTF